MANERYDGATIFNSTMLLLFRVPHVYRHMLLFTDPLSYAGKRKKHNTSLKNGALYRRNEIKPSLKRVVTAFIGEPQNRFVDIVLFFRFHTIILSYSFNFPIIH